MNTRQLVKELFDTTQVDSYISVEELAKKFSNVRGKVGYEVESAGSSFVNYILYVELDLKRIGAIRLLLNKENNKTKIKSKSLVDWSVNWLKLTKPK